MAHLFLHRQAATFTLNVGDPVLYEKNRNANSERTHDGCSDIVPEWNAACQDVVVASGLTGSAESTIRAPEIAPLKDAESLIRPRDSVVTTTINGEQGNSGKKMLVSRHRKSVSSTSVGNLPRFGGTVKPTTTRLGERGPETGLISVVEAVAARYLGAMNCIMQRDFASDTIICGSVKVILGRQNVSPRAPVTSTKRDTESYPLAESQFWNTVTSCPSFSEDRSLKGNVSTMRTGIDPIIDQRTLNYGRSATHRGSESRIKSSGLVKSSLFMGGSTQEAPKCFCLRVGDPVLYGRWKNHHGVIKSFGVDAKGNPTITVEPVPKGRKQDKVMGLFKVWYDHSAGVAPVRVASRWLSSGELIRLPAPPPRPKGKTFRFHGNVYALSTEEAPMMVSDEPEQKGEGARLIEGPKPADPWKFLWVLDTDRDFVAMWRVTDGNEKAAGRSSYFTPILTKLDRKGQINRVSHDEFKDIDREMRRREGATLRSLQKWVEESKTDYQRVVDEVAHEVFHNDIEPSLKRRVREVLQGAHPFGFEVNPRILDHASGTQQAVTFVVGEELQKLTMEKVEDALRSRGVDPDAPGHDIQAADWAAKDVMEEVYKEYSRLPSARRVVSRYLTDGR